MHYRCARDGVLREVDPALAGLVGAAGDLAGRSLLELADPLDRERLAAALAGAGPRELTWRLRGAGGRIPLLDQAEPDGEGWRGALVDLRVAWRAEAEAEERAALSAQGELAASIAHEVNNPLSGVLNYAQLAARLAQEQPQLREALAGIESEARRIHELTRALAIHAPRPSDEAYPLAADALLRAVVAPRRRGLREDLIQVETEVAPDLPPLGGRGLVLQAVCRELLANAHEALVEAFPNGRDPGKRLRLRARGDPAGGELPDEVWLEVEDGGPGFPTGAGEPFFSTRPGRRGLGLTRCREALALLGGRLELRAAPGGGGLARCVVPAWS